MLVKAISAIISSDHQIELIESRVDQQVSEGWWNDVCIRFVMVRVEMQHVHCITDVNEQEQDDQQEVADVNESSHDQSHVE